VYFGEHIVGWDSVGKGIRGVLATTISSKGTEGIANIIPPATKAVSSGIVSTVACCLSATPSAKPREQRDSTADTRD
jgi:hypothetical protein